MIDYPEIDCIVIMGFTRIVQFKAQTYELAEPDGPPTYLGYVVIGSVQAMTRLRNHEEPGELIHDGLTHFIDDGFVYSFNHRAFLP